MDDNNNLLRRNIELGTELRLVKEQLAQAQNGTQYLVNCFSNQQAKSPTHDTAADRVERQLQRAQAENCRLRARLELTDSLSHKVNLRHRLSNARLQRQVDLGHSSDISDSSVGSAEFGEPGTYANPDLLTFDLEPDSPSTSAWQSPTDSFDSVATGQSTLIDSATESPIVSPLTPSTPANNTRHVFASASRDYPIGLGISGAPLRAQSKFISPQYSVVEQILHPSHASNPDNSFSSAGQWLPLNQPRASVKDERFAVPFLDREHNRLLNAAIFVEEMSEDEKTEHWHRLALDSRGRHNAEEWRIYYETMVRPAHLAKDRASTDIDAGEIEDAFADDEGNTAEHSTDVEQVVGAECGLVASRWAPQADIASGSVSVGKDTAASLRAAQQSCSNSSRAEIGEHTSSEQKFDAVSKDSSRQSPVEVNPTSSEMLSSAVKVDSVLTQVSPLPAPVGPPEAPQAKALLPSDAINSSFSNSTERTPAGSQHGTPLDSPRHSRPPLRLNRSIPTEIADIMPNYGVEDERLYQTVLISNVPVNVSLAEVLAKVRGGKVVSASYISTAGMKLKESETETNVVMVRFWDWRAAKKFVEFCKKNTDIVSFADAPGQVTPAAVSLIRTPSRPLHHRLIQDMHYGGLTRVLFVIDNECKGTPEQVSDQFARCGVRRPLVASRDDDGVLVFEFADARDAGRAWQVVDECYSFFRGASKGPYADPCGRPLGGLVEDVSQGEGGAEKTGDCKCGRKYDADDGKPTAKATTSFEEDRAATATKEIEATVGSDISVASSEKEDKYDGYVSDHESDMLGVDDLRSDIQKEQDAISSDSRGMKSLVWHNSGLRGDDDDSCPYGLLMNGGFYA